MRDGVPQPVAVEVRNARHQPHMVGGFSGVRLGCVLVAKSHANCVGPRRGRILRAAIVHVCFDGLQIVCVCAAACGFAKRGHAAFS
jgi:hypothetical protein